MLIPTVKSEPKDRFEDFRTLIYGAPKVGKSTFCSQFDGALFLDTENGLNSLSVYKVPIARWEDFLAFLKEFDDARKAGKLAKAPFKTLIVDTIDNLYMMASKYTCDSLKIVHETDLDYGKGWSATRKTFTAGISWLEGMGYGVVYTSHAVGEQEKTRTGEYTRYKPTMTGQCSGIMMPRFDFILFAQILAEGEVTRRVMQTKPTQYWEAGDKTGRLPDMIPLDARAFLTEFEKTKEAKA